MIVSSQYVIFKYSNKTKNIPIIVFCDIIFFILPDFNHINLNLNVIRQCQMSKHINLNLYLYY